MDGSCELCVFFILIIGSVKCINFQQKASMLINEKEDVVIECKHDDSSMYYMLWYQQKNITDMSLIGYIYGEKGSPNYEDAFKNGFTMSRKGMTEGSLTISNLQLSDSAVYYCAASSGDRNEPAYFGDGTKLTVLDKEIKITGPTVKVLDVSENEVCTKTNVTLVCVAEEFYPDHVSVSWSVDGDKRTTDVSTDEAAIQDDKTKFYSISSRLNINYKDEWTKGKTFTCTVSFFNEKNYTEHSDSLTGPKLGGEDLVEKYIHSANVTMLAYGMFIGKSIAYGLFILYVIKRQGFISK